MMLPMALAGCGRSSLLGFDDGCNGDPVCEARLHGDGGNRDGGNRDGGNRDGGNRDGGNRDGGNRDGGNRDGGNRDGGNRDGGNRDGGNRDGGNRDGGNRDGGNRDGGVFQPDLRGVDLAGCVPHPEVCNNFIDDDCDTLVDCQDPDCRNSAECVNMRKEICNNGVDDDNNGLTDCADPACFGDPHCFVPGQEICNNGIDDDGDGLTDCADPDCFTNPICTMHSGNEICDNGIDDNGDHLVDCDDPQCVAFPACVHFDCTPDVEFGTINPHDSTATQTMDTTLAVRSFNTCAFPGGTARVGEFTLTGTADVRLDFTQAAGAAHVVSLFAAGALQACDQNLIFCLNAGQAPTATHTYAALPPGTYRVIVQSFPGTQGSTTVTLSTSPSSKVEICDNGVDDDGNGLTDCADLACKNDPSCVTEECNPDINLGTLVVGGPSHHANFDTHSSSNRNHPTCAGTSTGDDEVVEVTLAQTAGILVQWTQTGDHVITVFKMPGPGQACDAIQQSCYYPGGASGGQVAFSPRSPGSYLLIFKAVRAGSEGVIDINVSAFQNQGTEICNNGIDDDGDGLVDCNDPDCFGVGSCRPPVCVPDVDLGDFNSTSVQSLVLDTTTAHNYYSTKCGQGTGKERVIQLNVTEPIALGFSCTESSDHVLQLAAHLNPLDSCDANEFNCADPAILPFGCNFAMPNIQAGRYEVIVEAFRAGDEGTVDLTLFGIAETVLEICDNKIDDDGDGFTDCDDLKCVTSPECSQFACHADQDLGTLPLDGTTTETAVVNTSSGTVPTRVPMCVTQVGGKEAVVDFTVPSTADVTVQWAQAGDHDFAVYLDQSHAAACDAGPIVDCVASSMSGGAGSFTLTALARGKYHLVTYADVAGDEGGVVLQLVGAVSPVP